MEEKKRASQMGFLQCPAEWMWSRDVRKGASQSYTLHTYPSIYLAIPIPSNKRVSPVGKYVNIVDGWGSKVCTRPGRLK